MAEISQDFIARNVHIPTDEIENDIKATEQEIAQMEKEASHLEQTPMSLPSAKLDHMRAIARRSGIAERKQFVEKLQALLAFRAAQAGEARLACNMCKRITTHLNVGDVDIPMWKCISCGEYNN